jgi:epoxyqueuosine reductase
MEREPGGEAFAREALQKFFSARSEILEWGVARIDGPLPNAERLSDWVAQGMHAGLRYMEENLEKRKSPARLFPWARSAVVFSLRQPAPFGADTGEFRVAAYALGEDYHRLARLLLGAAEQALREATGEGIRFHGFCDTWPVFERDLAAEAGLGWRGKNACLIHPRHGSGFLLAGFFTDLELGTPAVPLQDFCGQCTACLDQCPTGALTEPGRLDANKCIGYWTVESKGDIPNDIARQHGDWIFGCDICQDVCPWNHKAKKTAGPASSPEGWPKTAREWLGLLRQGGGFQSRFRHTPLLRAGRKGLLRNVLIALQNRSGRHVRDQIESLAGEENDPGLRKEIENALKAAG